MIVGYARVSTDGQTLDAQQAELRNAGAERVYSEKISGAVTDRPALAKAIAALGNGDTLIVTKLDRLARSTRDLLNTLDAIGKAGASFRSLTDSWANTDTVATHREELAELFFSGNAATYDQIAKFSTLGLDGFWKRKILSKIPKTSSRIIEQASGTGILTCEIARRLPKGRITGVELNEEYLSIAREKARKLTNVEFIHGRAEEVILEGEFDCIVSAYLAKYVELDLLVAHARKMLREGGVLIMHELTRPTNLLFLAFWKMHFKFLQTYGKWKHPEWDIAFRNVSLLLEKTQWVGELTRALRANEFVDIQVEHLIFGASAIVSARSKCPSRNTLPPRT